MRRHVTGRTGIVIVPPGTANLGRALENREVLDTGFLELNGHAEPGETGAHDGDVHIGIHGLGSQRIESGEKTGDGHGDLRRVENERAWCAFDFLKIAIFG